MTEIERLLRPHRLTFARFEVLRLLTFSRNGSLPIGKVGDRLQVHPASVTNAVQRLEADGLVARGTRPDDRRSVLVSVTPAGRRLVDRCTAVLNAEVFETLPMTAAAVRRTYTTLRRLRHDFGDFA